MAVDGHVDFVGLFNKARINDVKHDGKNYVEAHAEFEAAMCEAFGIKNGMNISDSVFGTVAADGSWSLARFSSSTTKSDASAAVGWEFRDNARAVRFAQISGTIQVWVEEDDETWSQVRDLENIVDGPLTSLVDVSIDLPLPDPAETDATSVKVIGQEDNPGFGLGADTTTSGAEAFVDLDDVVTNIYAPYIIGSPGSVLETFDDSGTDKIKAKLIPALVEESKPIVGWFRGQLDMEPYIESRPVAWQAAGSALGSNLANWVGLDSDGRIHLSEAGVYRVTLMWIMNSGSTWDNRFPDDGNPWASAIVTFFHPGSGLNLFPPRDFVGTEPTWAFGSHDGILFQGLHIGNYFDGFTTLMVSSGGSQAIFNPHWGHNMAGGTRQFTVWIEVERFA